MSRLRLFEDTVHPHDRTLIEAEVGCELHALEWKGTNAMKTIKAEKDYLGKVRAYEGQHLTVDDETAEELLTAGEYFSMVEDYGTAAEPAVEPAPVVESKKPKKGKGSESDLPGAPPEE